MTTFFEVGAKLFRAAAAAVAAAAGAKLLRAVKGTAVTADDVVVIFPGAKLFRAVKGADAAEAVLGAAKLLRPAAAVGAAASLGGARLLRCSVVTVTVEVEVDELVRRTPPPPCDFRDVRRALVSVAAKLFRMGPGPGAATARLLRVEAAPVVPEPAVAVRASPDRRDEDAGRTGAADRRPVPPVEEFRRRISAVAARWVLYCCMTLSVKGLAEDGENTMGCQSATSWCGWNCWNHASS